MMRSTISGLGTRLMVSLGQRKPRGTPPKMGFPPPRNGISPKMGFPQNAKIVIPWENPRQPIGNGVFPSEKNRPKRVATPRKTPPYPVGAFHVSRKHVETHPRTLGPPLQKMLILPLCLTARGCRPFSGILFGWLKGSYKLEANMKLRVSGVHIRRVNGMEPLGFHPVLYRLVSSGCKWLLNVG